MEHNCSPTASSHAAYEVDLTCFSYACLYSISHRQYCDVLAANVTVNGALSNCLLQLGVKCICDEKAGCSSLPVIEKASYIPNASCINVEP